jgi:chromate transporter
MNSQIPRPGHWQLLRLWATIGLQSFGGGASTTFLIQRTFIETYHYLTAEEFTHFWSLCIPTPGITLIAVTILIGRRLGGRWGILTSLVGLLLPSATITCALAALFQQIEHFTAVQAVLKGMVPATGVIMLLVAGNFAWPLLRKSSKEGTRALLANGAVIVLCTLGVIVLKLSAILVVVSAIVLGALCFSPRAESISPKRKGRS